MSIHINVHSSQDTFDEVSRNEMLEKILSIVENKLSKQEKLFARLYWFKKLSPDEISKILNISLENTHLLKHRAEKKIKRYMKGIWNIYEPPAHKGVHKNPSWGFPDEEQYPREEANTLQGKNCKGKLIFYLYIV